MKSARPPTTPPLTALKKLEQSACRDLTVARLTLGLFGAVDGGKPRLLFPGYHWCLSDVKMLSTALAASAHRVMEWGANRKVDLTELMISRAKILNAVYARRRQSPYGRRRIAIANRWRKRYPQSKSTVGNFTSRMGRVRAVRILRDETGRPLSVGTLRFVRAFRPSQIEILAHGEGERASLRAGAVKIQLGKDGYTVTAITLNLVVTPSKRRREIHGVLADFFETGTEGVIWSVLDDEDRGYDALSSIEEGDHLTILDPFGKKLWAGKILCDREAGWRRYPLNPKYGQPCALGHWVHWTQRGFKPDVWAGYFIRPDYDRLRGVLRKKRP